MADHNEGIEHGYHAHLGKVSKKVNSTKQIPLSELSDKFPFYMKRACSMEAPVFYVRYNSLNISPQWNYCYIEETHAYYWIEDITALNANNWQFSCAIDPLATFADSIKKTKAYILYGHNDFDASGASYRIQDSRQNVAQRPTISTASADITINSIDTDEGVYIMSAVGAKGGVATYVMDRDAVKSLLDAIQQQLDIDFSTMITQPQTKTTIVAQEGTLPGVAGGAYAGSQQVTETYTQASTVTDEAIKYFAKNYVYGGAAVDCIRSCIWLPLRKSIIPGSSQSITLGQYDTGVQGAVIRKETSTKRITYIPIPWPVSDWKRMNCQMLLYLPFVGTVSIPVDKVNNADTLTVTWAVSFLDGNVSVKVDAGDYTCYVGSANIASQYAIGSSNISLTGNQAAATIGAIGIGLQVGGGLLSSSASQSATTFMGLPIGGDYGAGLRQSRTDKGAALSSLGSSVMQLIPPVAQCAGSMTGNAATKQSMLATLTLLYYPPTDDTNFQSMYGHPVMKIDTPAAGYCQTRGFSVAAPMATSAETAYINAAMDGGVFIE